jgi:5-methylcytosine-specific restriction endonuclease McrA
MSSTATRPSRRAQRAARRKRFLRQIIERDGLGCVWCNTQLSVNHRDASIEHVIPRAHGGADVIENMALACKGCNRRRSDKPALEWLAACERDPTMRPRANIIRAAISRYTNTVSV